MLCAQILCVCVCVGGGGGGGGGERLPILNAHTISILVVSGASSLGSCDLHDIITQGHVIMMSQPQSIYQKVIDKTKGLAFQAQFLAQSIDKRLAAQENVSKIIPPQPVCVYTHRVVGKTFVFL